MRYFWKNAGHVENCGTVGKIGQMRHSWKSASHLEKCETLGKMRHAWLTRYVYINIY